jgi:hypothetical protein
MNKLNILINDYNRYIRRANQFINLIKKQDEAKLNKHLSVMPRNVINNIFYFLESDTATIYKQEIKRNKKHIIKGSDIISDYVMFNRPRVDFEFLDIEFCMNGLSPTYSIQNAKAECFMINNIFNKQIFYINEDGKVAIDERLYLKKRLYEQNLIDEEQHRAEELREIYIRVIESYKQFFMMKQA